MKLEVGRKYVLNNGDVVGPIDPRDHSFYPFRFDFPDQDERGGLTWNSSGEYLHGNPYHPFSIASEFVPAIPAIKEAAEHPADREQGELQMIRNAFNTHFPEWTLFGERKSDVMAMVEYLATLKRTIVSLGESLQACKDQKKPVSKEACIEIVEKIARGIVDTAEEWKRESKGDLS